MDKMIITQTFTSARWQIVVKRSDAPKQNKDQNNNKNKQTKQQKQNNNNKQKQNNNNKIKINNSENITRPFG